MPNWDTYIQQWAAQNMNQWTFTANSASSVPVDRFAQIVYDRGGAETRVHSSDYFCEWFMGGAYYPNFYDWANDPQNLGGVRGTGNSAVNLCRAIRDEAYRLDAEYNQAHNIEPLAPWERELLGIVDEQTPSTTVGNPNHINEGGTMPETGIEQVVDTIEIEQSPYARGNAFENLGLRDQLMTGLDIENWQRVLEQLREATGPVLHQIVRGSFEVGLPTTYVRGRGTRIDYIKIEAAAQIVDSASDGKIKLVPIENRDGYYTIRPNHSLDAAGFVNYAGSPDLYVESQGDGNQMVYIRDLRNAMSMYADYRAGSRRTYILNAMRENLRGSNPRKPEAPLAFSRDRATKLDEFIKSVQKNTKLTPNPLSLIPILPHKTKSSRRWGIEIEHPDIYGVTTPAHWALHGDGSLRGRDNYDEDDEHESGCDWYDDEPCDCGYYDRVAEAGDRPSVTGEWNSPILHSFHSRGLKHLMDGLAGRYENDTAGVHVHVEASDLTPEQAVRLTMIYTALEPLFQSEYHRETRNYCKSVDLGELVNRFNAMRELKGKKSTEFIFHSRYWTVNMAALNTHGTIEFRAMGPVYEYEHLIRWAAFCREMVNIAKANVPQKVWSKVHTFQDLVVLFSKYGKETPTPKWAEDEPLDFEEVLGKLGTENRRRPNARPSNAYSRYGEAPAEVFDDYYGAVVTSDEPNFAYNL